MRVHLTSFGLPRSERAPSQDAFATHRRGEMVIAVLADGVGSARSGGEASQQAVETMVRHYTERPQSWSPERSLQEFTRQLNHRLFQDSLQRFGQPELVSTLAVAVLEGDRLYGVNVGDSRVYLARGGELNQLSQDHVLGERPGEAHVLTQALGLAEEVQPHFFEQALEPGDVALLCSDGVSHVLSPATLSGRLGQRCTARTIVAEARERATPEQRDDASAIVVEVTEPGRTLTREERALPVPATLRRGDQIDGFTLVRPFQHSERVWLATREGERCTLKFAPVEAATHEALREIFAREVWQATRLAAPFFPRAFVPAGASASYYAMEFIEAPSLRVLLRSRRLAVEEGIALGRFLLTAAQHLLRRDLVHGDLKPENILTTSGYAQLDYRLIDFGSITEVFATTSRAGTASYLAPERFRESPISERTELFAIGVTLYEALTGSLPFGEIERFQTPHFTPAGDPRQSNPNLPPWLAAVLLRATAIQPERRYQTYSEMLFELEHPAAVTPFHSKDAPLLERDPLRFYRTGFFILLATTLALLLTLLLRS